MPVYNEHLVHREFRFAPIGGGIDYRAGTGSIVYGYAPHCVRDMLFVQFGDGEIRGVGIRDLISLEGRRPA